MISGFSCAVSDGELGEDAFAYRGPSLSASTLREEALWQDIVSGKRFI